MIIFDEQTIVLAVLGLLGLLATATVVGTVFSRNRLGTGRWQ